MQVDQRMSLPAGIGAGERRRLVRLVLDDGPRASGVVLRTIRQVGEPNDVRDGRVVGVDGVQDDVQHGRIRAGRTVHAEPDEHQGAADVLRIGRPRRGLDAIPGGIVARWHAWTGAGVEARERRARDTSVRADGRIGDVVPGDCGLQQFPQAFGTNRVVCTAAASPARRAVADDLIGQRQTLRSPGQVLGGVEGDALARIRDGGGERDDPLAIGADQSARAAEMHVAEVVGGRGVIQPGAEDFLHADREGRVVGCLQRHAVVGHAIADQGGGERLDRRRDGAERGELAGADRRRHAAGNCAGALHDREGDGPNEARTPAESRVRGGIVARHAGTGAKLRRTE